MTQRSNFRLVTRLRPGNADQEALPPAPTRGRASFTAFPGGTWERANELIYRSEEESRRANPPESDTNSCAMIYSPDFLVSNPKNLATPQGNAKQGGYRE
jgi:hypothetical protein